MIRYGPPNCSICKGRECWGGGNQKCVQRDPRISKIAGILDSYGGISVVVTYPGSFKHHLRHGEFLCMVFGKTVHEPIAWGDIPYVIALGELAVEQWAEKHRDDNDPNVRDAIRAYRSRKLWYHKRSLDLQTIVFT